MKTFWIIFALLAFAFFMVMLVPFCSQYTIVKQGTIVRVVIKSIPGVGLGKGDYMHFYNDSLNDIIKVYGDYQALHHVGDTIELRYLNHRFLFKNQNPIATWIGLLIFLFFCGMMFLYYAFSKTPPDMNAISSK